MNADRVGDAGQDLDDQGGPSLTLPPDTRSVVTARRTAREMLAVWNAEDLEWAASQLVTELATNAVLHAGTSFRVVFVLRAETLRCEVSDSSPLPPRLRHYSLDATTGRGLKLVDRLSSSWGVIARPDGKTVWFELERTSGDEGAEPDLDELLEAFDTPPAPVDGDGSRSGSSGPTLRSAAA